MLERFLYFQKFHHSYFHYGQAHSRTQEDYKAVSQNVIHSITGITDQFYSNMNDDEKRERIDSIFSNHKTDYDIEDEFKEFLEFLDWKNSRDQKNSCIR